MFSRDSYRKDGYASKSEVEVSWQAEGEESQPQNITTNQDSTTITVTDTQGSSNSNIEVKGKEEYNTTDLNTKTTSLTSGSISGISHQAVPDTTLPITDETVKTNPIVTAPQNGPISSWKLDTSINPAELPPLNAVPGYSPLATSSTNVPTEDTSSWSLDNPIPIATVKSPVAEKKLYEPPFRSITTIASGASREAFTNRSVSDRSRNMIPDVISRLEHSSWADTDIPALAHMQISNTEPTKLRSPSLTGVSALLASPSSNNFTSILCISNIKGSLNEINSLIKKTQAKVVIHVGDFGFYDETSFQRLSDKELRQAVQSSNALSPSERTELLKLPDYGIRNAVKNRPQILSQLTEFIQGRQMFDAPVYAIFGGQEDVKVVEKVASNIYKIPNLHLVNPKNSPSFEIEDSELPGERKTIRLFGFGGNIDYQRFFDLGDGGLHSAGKEGNMWSTILHVGEILEAAETFANPQEIRILMTHTIVSKESLVNLLARIIKADFTINAGYHQKYCQVSTDWSNYSPLQWREFVGRARKEIPKLWTEAQDAVPKGSLAERSHQLMQKVLKMLSETFDEESLKTPIHVILPDSKDGNAVFRMTEKCLKLQTNSEGDAYHLHSRNNHSKQPSHNSFSSTPQSLNEEISLQSQRAIKGGHKLIHAIADSTSSGSSTNNYEHTVVISNFPNNIILSEIRESLLRQYRYKFAQFMGRDSNRVVVTFREKEEAERAATGLDGTMIEGERIRAHFEERAKGTSIWAHEVRKTSPAHTHDAKTLSDSAVSIESSPSRHVEGEVTESEH